MNVFHKITLKTLGKNKTRTLVTIIGIILSAAMITAVTSCVTSLRNFLVESTIAQDGDWHGAVFGIEIAQLENVEKSPEVSDVTSIQNIGYALLSGSQNESKPYIYIGGMADNFKDMLPVYLTSGKMPENSSEIILPKHLKTNGGVSYALGDILTLDIGTRMSGGSVLNQNKGYASDKSGQPEVLTVREQRSYTVVGFYERPSFESYSAAGYTALTVADAAGANDLEVGSYDVYIKINSPKNIDRFLELQFPESEYRLNSNLLRFTGNSNDKSLNAVLYSLAGILITIIVFGSISLIYNAFSISVSERTKQFGLLSSVGATRRQMTRSVLFEAAYLSLIGIPIGILAGIAGIGITLKLSEKLFSSFLNSYSDVVLSLSVSWSAVAAAAVIGLVTVLISAYIPAKRALKVSAIDAIRQTKDINIKAKKVKTSKLTYKLFGFEGMIASKNFKRNRKKYRATVISLFMSVVLFISASSFCAYLAKSADSLISDSEYDIVYRFTTAKAGDYSLQELFKELSGVSGVAKAGYASNSYQNVKIPRDLVNKDYIEYFSRVYGDEFLNAQPGQVVFDASLHFVDDATYREYLQNNSLNEDTYMDTTSPKAVVLDFVKLYNGEEGRYYTFNLLNIDTRDMTLFKITHEVDGFYLANSRTDDAGNVVYIYENKKGEKIELPEDKAVKDIALKTGTIEDNKPFCVDKNYSGITLLYPYDAMPAIPGISDGTGPVTMYFKVDNHRAAYDKMINVLEKKGLPTGDLHNYAERAESNRALIAVINIFSYGFIILISLIAAANVFNTISTNIGLRRREFAMLKSIGMTRKGFNKMMNYECLLYGIKGLVYGIPVSVGVTWLIYRSIRSGWETSFFIPWYSVVIAVGSVFAVVFTTMLYSMSRIKKDNPIDALKNENL